MKHLRFAILKRVPKFIPNCILICLFTCAWPAILIGQTNTSQPSPADSPAPTAATAGNPSAAAESHTPEIAPTKILEYAPPPAEYARSKAYSRAHYRHFFV